MFQFKIQIKDLKKPPVWRRVLVPETFTFHQFHEVIQVAFEWFDEHLYQFTPKGYGTEPKISIPSEYEWEPSVDSTKLKLKDIFKTKGQSFVYIYDFGDDWTHKITLEEITEEKGIKPSCIAGKGACPPEDCGGIYGYERIKEVFANRPESEEADDLREWLGLEDDEVWDVNEFNMEEVNEEMKCL